MHLSPSENHRHQANLLPLPMAYRGGEVNAWQTALRSQLRELIGLPRAESTEVDAQLLWRQEHELGSIEKLILSGEEKADIPAYFCTPRHTKPPYAVMICLQGHSTGMHNSIGLDRETETHAIAVEGDRDFALGALRRGFAALCIEQRSLGTRRELHQQNTSPNCCHDAAMRALMLGRTLQGERVFDVARGIDYLQQRSDVDLQRLGIMGNSGGGTTAIYAAALLDRIQFAMPSCAFCTYRGSSMQIYHCSCHYIPGILQLAEYADILGLFAPKPVVIVSGRDDEISPLQDVQQAFNSLQKIYQAAGAPDNCRLVVGEGGHRFYEDEGWAALLPLLTR
jgi:dienelactone hydrolase